MQQGRFATRMHAPNAWRAGDAWIMELHVDPYVVLQPTGEQLHLLECGDRWPACAAWAWNASM